MPTKLLLFYMACTMIYASSMTTIVHEAIEHNHKLKSYKYSIQAAFERVDLAKDQLWPSLNASASIGKDKYYYNYPSGRIDYDTKTTSYQIFLKQPIYRPKIFDLIKESKLKVRYAQIQKRDFINSLVRQVLGLYVDILYYHAIQILYSKQIDNYNAILHEIKQKRALRFATDTDVALAKADLATAVSNKAQAQYTLQSLLHRLAIYIGKVPSVSASLHDSIKDFSISKLSIDHNPQLLLAKIDVQIAANEIKKRKRSFYPTLDLSASYGDTDSSDSITRRKNSRIFLELQVPLFSKQNFDAIDEATYLYQASKQNFFDTKERLRLQSINVYYNIFSTKNLLQMDLSVIEAKKIYKKQALLSYRSSLISLSDLSKAINSLYDALIQKEYHKKELTKNLIEYFYLAGKLMKRYKQIDSFIIKE